MKRFIFTLILGGIVMGLSFALVIYVFISGISKAPLITAAGCLIISIMPMIKASRSLLEEEKKPSSVKEFEPAE